MYVAAIALVTLIFGWHNVKAQNDWAIGEWLINYAAGFVRRGLLGQIVLELARFTHIPIFVVVLAIEMLLYLTFFLCVLSLVRGLRWSLPLAAILLSPATLAFPILDPPAGFRKEDILFAGLALLVTILVFRRPRAVWLSVFLVLFTQFAVLSHEPLVLYLPYVFGAVFLAVPRLRRAVLICAAPALLSLVAAFVVSRHPGNAGSAAIICSSFGSRLGLPNEGVCGGAILYLSRDLGFARMDVVRLSRHYHYFVIYPIGLLLTAIPFLLLLRRLARNPAPRLRHELRVLLLTIVVACVTSAPLFVIATDWGRWISMHAICLMLLVLLVLGRERTAASKAVAEDTAAPQSPRRRAAGALALVLYATCWTLPGVGLYPGRFGYVDLVRYLTRYGSLTHARPSR